MDRLEDYDYMELVVMDIHSIARGRLVAKRRMASILETGLGMYGGICFFGLTKAPPRSEYFIQLDNRSTVQMCPLPETLTDVLPCVKTKHRVGQMMCTLKRHDGSIEMTTPRALAEKQLASLHSLGYSIRSSFELEFAIYYADTLEPFGHDREWADMRVIGQQEDVLLDFLEELRAIGICADTLQAENGCGQYEITLDLGEGVQVADMVARFKNAAQIFFRKRKLKVSFMTCDMPQNINSHGFHFNHSLWTEDGQSLFPDCSNPGKLSAVGRHWLAGLIAHTRALTALCCPTVNCYRRLNEAYVPCVAGWGTMKGNKSYRLKAEAKDNVYLESRIPSSASNPYLVMAGVVAAGIDGIKRKLPLEDAECDRELPLDLEEALTALEEDDYMVEALGKIFVDMFANTKRTGEIGPMKAFGELSKEEQFGKELEMYFDN